MKYKIVTEASVDMPKKFAEENDITILPIEVNFNGELYPEGMPNDEFYAKLKSTGIIPKTSQPNQYKFENALTPYCNKDGWFVLTIVISSNHEKCVYLRFSHDNFCRRRAYHGNCEIYQRKRQKATRSY